jgi:regulatory protein YycI of two-component signal transduction system YycFG
MKSIWKIAKENREEAIKFLETQEGERYTFVKYDKENDEWLDPHDNDEECYPDEIAPSVTYGNDDGEIKEYLVTSIWLETKENGEKRIVASVADASYFECYDYPVLWLYGVSECYIYEALMNAGLIKED